MKRHINVKHQYIYIYLDTCITNISYILIYVHGNFKKTYTTYIEIAVGNSYHKCKCFTIYKPNPAAPSNGNSSWYMKRKASNFQDDFDKCVGIAGVSDSNLRKILSRLHKEKEPSSKSRTVTKRFPDLHNGPCQGLTCGTCRCPIHLRAPRTFGCGKVNNRWQMVMRASDTWTWPTRWTASCTRTWWSACIGETDLA